MHGPGTARCWLPSLLFLLVFTLPAQGAVYYGAPGWYEDGRQLPNSVDLFEWGLSSWQDFWGPEDPYDPASVVALMEDQAARWFDFGSISYRVAGSRYARMDILSRAHFQNRVKDRLFTLLAVDMGMYKPRVPKFGFYVPRRIGANNFRFGGYLLHADGRRVRLDFDVYLSNRGWRIYDVRSNGLSLIGRIRQELRSSGQALQARW